MNAPWPHSGPSAAALARQSPPAAKLGGRDPVAAFVGDDASLACVKLCIAELGWGAAPCQTATMDEAVEALAATPSPAILIIDLSDCAAPLEEIHALAQVSEAGTMVIAVGQANDVQLYRALLASGIHDYLLKPLSAPSLTEALLSAQAALAAARQADTNQHNPHVTTAVIGTRGGVGASMLATSLAWLSSTALGNSTALLDLDFQFGTGALTLDLDPGNGLIDAIENPARIDGLFIERAMIRASGTLALLSAEAPIALPPGAQSGSSAATLLHLAEELRHAFSATVIDLPRGQLGNATQLLAETNMVLVVTDLTLAGARDTMRILEFLKDHAPLARVLLVANKVPHGLCEIGPSDFAAAVERPVDFLLPCDARVAIAAAKHGQTFAEADMAGRLGETLRTIAQAACATDKTEHAAPITQQRPSLLARLNPRTWPAAGLWSGRKSQTNRAE